MHQIRGVVYISKSNRQAGKLGPDHGRLLSVGKVYQVIPGRNLTAFSRSSRLWLLEAKDCSRPLDSVTFPFWRITSVLPSVKPGWNTQACETAPECCDRLPPNHA